MNAQVAEGPRYAGHSDAEKGARIRHEMQFEARLKRASLREVRWKCTHCRKGSVTLTGHWDARGQLRGTSGLCSTPGCLDWGN
jgi:hypothetical protein